MRCFPGGQWQPIRYHLQQYWWILCLSRTFLLVYSFKDLLIPSKDGLSIGPGWGFSSKMLSQIAKFMGPTWGPPGSCRPQMGPMLAPWTLLSGILPVQGFPLWRYDGLSATISFWLGSIYLRKMFYIEINSRLSMLFYITSSLQGVIPTDSSWSMWKLVHDEGNPFPFQSWKSANVHNM